MYPVRSSVRLLNVTVGDITWARDALGGIADAAEGRGTFTVVQLGRVYPDTAVQWRREFRRDHRHESRFDRSYRIVVEDTSFAPELASDALRRAYVRNRIPPWSVVGDKLVVVVEWPFDRRHVRRSVRDAATILELLGIVESPDQAERSRT